MGIQEEIYRREMKLYLEIGDVRPLIIPKPYWCSQNIRVRFRRHSITKEMRIYLETGGINK